jgi:hypothetical protein
MASSHSKNPRRLSDERTASMKLRHLPFMRNLDVKLNVGLSVRPCLTRDATIGLTVSFGKRLVFVTLTNDEAEDLAARLMAARPKQRKRGKKALADGNAIVAVLSKSAVKVSREGVTPPDIVDVDTLVTGTSRKGRPW